MVLLNLADFGANPQVPDFSGYGVGVCAVGQGQQGQPTEAAQRAAGVPVVGAGAVQCVEQFRGLLATPPPSMGAVAQRTLGTGVAGEDQRPVRQIP
jgi:hypothetical protein